jgi:hypothetical protein
MISDKQKKEFEDLVNNRLTEEDFNLKAADENNQPYHSTPKTFIVKEIYKNHATSPISYYMIIQFDTTLSAYERGQKIKENFKLCNKECYCGGQLIKNNKCNKYIKELMEAGDKYTRAHFEYLKIKEKSDRWDEEQA